MDTPPTGGHYRLRETEWWRRVEIAPGCPKPSAKPTRRARNQNRAEVAVCVDVRGVLLPLTQPVAILVGNDEQVAFVVDPAPELVPSGSRDFRRR